MYTSIKFHALKGRPIEEQRSLLYRAIDLELRTPQILMDVFEKRPDLLNAKRFFAANDPRMLSDADVQTRIKSFLLANPTVLLDADGQKAAINSGGLDGAKAAVFGEKYATASDNPILVDLSARFASFFHSNMPDIDTGYMPLFDLIDLRNMAQDHFDIDDTNAGITFTQIKPGGVIKKRTNISETKTTVPFLTFAAAVGILDDWLRFQQFWKIDEFVGEIRAKHFDQMANLHYGLLTAIGAGINETFLTDDATTFNKGAATLMRNLRNMGYAMSQNAALKIVCAPEKVGRILAMLEAQRGSNMVAFGTQKQPIAFTVDSVVASTFIPSADLGYYLVLPGKKAKRGLWQDLSIENLRNPAIRAQDMYASGQYNAAFGDTNQVRRVLYA